MKSGSSSFWTNGSVPLIEPDALRSILGAAADIALVIDEAATVLAVIVGPNSESFGDLSHWEGRPLVDFLADDSIAKFQKAHNRQRGSDAVARPLELNHADNVSWRHPVRYTFHHFGPADTMLMLGRDLSPIAETQQRLVQAQIALEQGYEARREFDSRYRVMLAKTEEAVLFINVQDGRISDCSEEAARILGVKREAAASTPLAQLLQDRAPAELMESLLNASFADGGGLIEARTSRTDTRIIVTPSVFRTSGQRIIYCGLKPAGDVPKVSDAEAGRAMSLVRSASDAILFCDGDGNILSCNDSFLDIVGAAHGGDVANKSLGEYLLRGQIDLGVLLDNSQRNAHMRIYATKLINELGSRLSVEISVTRLSEAAGPVLAFILRDVSRVEGVRSTHGGMMKDDGNRNVMELVGSTSLKEIVAETTDVVEKMCIETAVNLTKNNRVAAAEMLGLSRQSLYVKLRKYGLLSKES